MPFADSNLEPRNLPFQHTTCLKFVFFIRHNEKSALIAIEFSREVPSRLAPIKLGVAELSYESVRNRHFLKLQIMN
jgi:hypothetical protein